MRGEKPLRAYIIQFYYEKRGVDAHIHMHGLRKKIKW